MLLLIGSKIAKCKQTSLGVDYVEQGTVVDREILALKMNHVNIFTGTYINPQSFICSEYISRVFNFEVDLDHKFILVKSVSTLINETRVGLPHPFTRFPLPATPSIYNHTHHKCKRHTAKQ